MNQQTLLSPASRRRSLIICLLILAALFCALLVRLPYGFDWSDEAYQSAVPYRFVLGDRPIVDTWEVHQFSGLMALPLLRVFLLCSGGSTAGVLLYFRYVNVIFQGLIALYGFFVLRRKNGDVPALLSAGLLLMHSHYAMNNFFYNTMTLLFLVLSALLVFDGLDGLDGGRPVGRLRLLLCLSGCAYALSVLAYPYVVLTLPVYLFFWLWLVRRQEKSAGRSWLWWALGIGCVFFAFVAYLLIRCPLSELLTNLPYLLSDPDHGAESLLWIIGYYFNAVRVLFGPVSYGAAGLLVLGAVTRFIKRENARRILRQIGLYLALLLLFGAVAWIIPYDYPDYHKINLSAMALSLLGPGLYLLSGKSNDRALLLYLLGFALSMAVQIGSNTRVRASTGMMLPASMATLLYLFDCMDELLPKGAGPHLRRLAIAGCAAQLLLIGGLRVTTVYRDAPIPALTSRLTEGPGKGLYTTPESAAAYDAICRDICTHAPKEGAILMTNLMPLGYLLTDLVPATPSAYNMTLDAKWLSMYFAAHPEREPAYIFCADGAYGVSNDISLQGAEQYEADAAYEMEQVSTGTIFIKKSN